MAKTYQPLATQTLGSAQASVTFSSISAAYTDLVIIMNDTATGGAANIFMQVGNASVDTGANYSDTLISANGSTVTSVRDTNQTRIFFTQNTYPETTSQNLALLNFQNYSNTTTYKTVLIRSNNAVRGTDATVGLWRSTAAINIIQIYTAAASFAIGSTFTLYGIKAA